LHRDTKRVEQDRAIELQKAEAKCNELMQEEQQLKQKIELLRAAEMDLSSNQGKINASVLLISDRLASSKQAVSERSAALFELEQLIADANTQQQRMAARGAVLERLADVLGPRGIQHFIFSQVLRQLEQIANAYLLVLAEGGIKLIIQGG